MPVLPPFPPKLGDTFCGFLASRPIFTGSGPLRGLGSAFKDTPWHSCVTLLSLELGTHLAFPAYSRDMEGGPTLTRRPRWTAVRDIIYPQTCAAGHPSSLAPFCPLQSRRMAERIHKLRRRDVPRFTWPVPHNLKAIRNKKLSQGPGDRTAKHSVVSWVRPGTEDERGVSDKRRWGDGVVKQGQYG